MKKAEIVLASASPRRRELMARVTPDFRVFPVDVDESAVPAKDPLEFAIAAAVLKAKAAAEKFPEAVVIGADTVVALGLRILGKPKDKADARAMLRALSGRRHRVMTGLAFFTKAEGRLRTGYDLTYVTFRELTEAMIDGYLDQETFLDKAGAYAVQEIGDAFVARMNGDYDNVVGFPVEKVRRLLARFTAPSLTVEVEDIDFPGSDGKAEAGGRKLLIPGAVTGERVLVQVVAGRGAAEVAEVIRVESASGRRAVARCPHFGPCGGCLFQHVEYGTQLELKERYLRRTLEEAGLPDAAAATKPIAGSPDLYGFRNKMEFSFGEKFGDLALGLREKTTSGRQTYRRTLPVGECPIFSPVVTRLFPVVTDYARENGLEGFEPATRKGHLRHLVLREGKRTGELMVILVTAELPELDFGALAGKLAAAAPEIRSVVHVSSNRGTDLVEFERMRFIAGVPFIEERLAGLSFRVYPPSFFQTNTAGAELLYGRIREGPGALLRQRGDRALARRRGGEADGHRLLARQYRQRRGERPRQPDRQRRLPGGHGRGPAGRAARRAGRHRHRRPAARRADGQGPAQGRGPRRAGHRLCLVQSPLASPGPPRLPGRGLPAGLALSLRLLPAHAASRDAGHPRPLNAGALLLSPAIVKHGPRRMRP
jgi:septum formation protein